MVVLERRQGWSGRAEVVGMMSDVVDRVAKLGHQGCYRGQLVRDRLPDHHRFIREYGYEMPVISEQHWTGCSSTTYGYLAHSQKDRI
jgi:phosphoketolase